MSSQLQYNLGEIYFGFLIVFIPFNSLKLADFLF